MPFAPVNGIQIYYEEYGKGPSTIVFAHGAGGNHLSWWQQVPFFSKKYRCIIFSHRHFHMSPELPGGPGVSAFVDDLAGLLDYLKIKESALVAQSMGGTTCFGFLIAYPARVKALVMSDTIAGSFGPHSPATSGYSKGTGEERHPSNIIFCNFPRT